MENICDYSTTLDELECQIEKIKEKIKKLKCTIKETNSELEDFKADVTEQLEEIKFNLLLLDSSIIILGTLITELIEYPIARYRINNQTPVIFQQSEPPLEKNIRIVNNGTNVEVDRDGIYEISFALSAQLQAATNVIINGFLNVSPPNTNSSEILIYSATYSNFTVGPGPQQFASSPYLINLTKGTLIGLRIDTSRSIPTSVVDSWFNIKKVNTVTPANINPRRVKIT